LTPPPLYNFFFVLFVERNNAGLKKLPQVLSEQTSDSFGFKLCTELRTAFSIFRSGLSVTGLARVCCASDVQTPAGKSDIDVCLSVTPIVQGTAFSGS
jgi:hypothetical protein